MRPPAEGLPVYHVERRTRQVAAVERIEQRGGVDERARATLTRYAPVRICASPPRRAAAAHPAEQAGAARRRPRAASRSASTTSSTPAGAGPRGRDRRRAPCRRAASRVREPAADAAEADDPERKRGRRGARPWRTHPNRPRARRDRERGGGARARAPGKRGRRDLFGRRIGRVGDPDAALARGGDIMWSTPTVRSDDRSCARPASTSAVIGLSPTSTPQRPTLLRGLPRVWSRSRRGLRIRRLEQRRPGVGSAATV